MADAELGHKHICTECSARFYDFNRTPITCPSCGAILQEPVSRLKRKTEEQSLSKASSFDVADPDTDSDEDDLLADDDDLDDDLDDDDDDISQDIDVAPRSAKPEDDGDE
ncbi:TIGR02300 family protein [Acetobacteraceae bacterium]|nr:TIGR02300 family protein [Acetobacteraceae bacterium]